VNTKAALAGLHLLGCGLCAALLFVACAKPTTGVIPVAYPPGWPVAAFTAPPEAVAAQLPQGYEGSGDGKMVAKQPLNADQPGQATMWAVAFEFSGGWDRAWAHADGCLKPLGYLLSDRSVMAADAESQLEGGHPLESIYVNPQRTQVLRLICSGDVYVLKAVVYAKPQSKVMPVFSKAQPIP
jgi:hypothetical protein